MVKGKTVISMLLPTRGRTEMLKRSIESLVNTAADPSRVEIILGIDEDEQDILSKYLQEEVASFLKEHNVECRANVFTPMGYTNLHQYVNTLAASANGDWLFFWNDDGVMLTENWDNEIEKYNGQFKLLAPKDNHDGHPYAIFPIVPRDWFMLMDHLSLNAQNDAWLSHIAYMLDIYERNDVEFLHDRADLTGNNDDETFQNRKYMEGNPEDPRDFGHPDMQQARVRSAYKIAWFLERIGQKSEWWERVRFGQQDPFEKMKANTSKSVKGAGVFAASTFVDDDTESKKKVDDEETLLL